MRTLLRNMNRIIVTRHHADEQVLADGLGGEVDQVGAVVVGLDLHAGQQPAGLVVELLDLGLDVLQGGQRFLALAQQDDALDHVVLVVTRRRPPEREDSGGLVAVGPARADPAQAGLVADDHAPLRRASAPGGSGPPSTTSSTRTGDVVDRRR